MVSGGHAPAPSAPQEVGRGWGIAGGQVGPGHPGVTVHVSRSMDKNGTMTIRLERARISHLLHPVENIPEIILYWKHPR